MPATLHELFFGRAATIRAAIGGNPDRRVARCSHSSGHPLPSIDLLGSCLSRARPTADSNQRLSGA